MKRFLLVWLLLVPVVIGSIAQLSLAQDPAERVDHFRLSRLSVLRQTGGIAGVDYLYALIGEYDFRHGVGFPATAGFENAEIWGSIISEYPTPPIVYDVDEVLNLEGLDGNALPVLGPIDVYKFTGLTLDGSSIRLFAAVLGPWMYLHGDTEPPPGSADFFVHHLRALARSTPFADFNGDGTVNAADYTLLRDSGVQDGAGVLGADYITAGAGYAEWKEQFGETVPDFSAFDAMLSAAAAGTASAAAAPEPSSVMIALVGCLMVAGRWRMRGV